MPVLIGTFAVVLAGTPLLWHLRFDFNHPEPVGQDALLAIEDEVNAFVRANVPVTTEEMSYDDAIRAGALAFFGDKYGDRVTVVRMGDFSTELCGGTHVARTGDIGFFRLDSESGVAAGVRRIEAATGQGAIAQVRREIRNLDEARDLLGSDDLAGRIERMRVDLRERDTRIAELQGKLAGGATRDVLAAWTASRCWPPASTGSTTRACATWPIACATVSSRASSSWARRWGSARCCSRR